MRNPGNYEIKKLSIKLGLRVYSIHDDAMHACMPMHARCDAMMDDGDANEDRF